MNYFTKCAFALIAVLAISGCASTAEIQQNMYNQRLAEQSKVDQEKQKTEQERFKVYQKMTDPTAQVVFATSEGIASALRASGAGGVQTLPAMPHIEGWDDKAFKWFDRIVSGVERVGPGVVQAREATKVARFTTEASVKIAESRDKAETDRLIAAGKANVDIAGKIQAPPGTNNYIGGDGVVGDGTINKLNLCQNQSGAGGNGGNGAPGGAGGENGSGGNNTAGAGAQSGAVPCTITK